MGGPLAVPDPLRPRVEGDVIDPERVRRVVRMVRLARLMDSQIRVPGTSFTFGLDPIIGLVPVLGDFVTMCVSLVILYDAIKLGATQKQILHMVFNICLDFLLGEIPALGDAFDVVFKANIKNLEVMGLDPNMDLKELQQAQRM